MTPIVETTTGPVRGTMTQGCQRWLGIPYARPERFGPPVPPAPWTEPLEAGAYADQCSQQYGRRVVAKMIEGEGYGEDCLFLNVWAPAGIEPGSRPVMVWIHGGAFVTGGANGYDGWKLAAENGVVVVTINYRLGVLGFVDFASALGLPSLESNLGLRDQIAALAWVRDNIAGFGGDPANVTVFGESAGSMSVSLLTIAPAARGLFHRAIMQSGALSMVHDAKRAAADAQRYLALFGVEPGSGEAGLAQLRSRSMTELIEAQAKVAGEVEPGVPAAPWYDGDLLPASLAEALVAPVAQVPMIAGATREEIRLFRMMPGGKILPTDRADLDRLVRAQLPADHAERVLAAYPRDKAGDIALGTDLSFLMPTRNFAWRHAADQPTFVYRFDYAHPILGAAHAMDLPALWPIAGWRGALVRGGLNRGRRKALGDRMRAHWAHFAREGRPLDNWPAYTREERKVLVLGLEDKVVADLDGERFAAWDGADVMARVGN